MRSHHKWHAPEDKQVNPLQQRNYISRYEKYDKKYKSSPVTHHTYYVKKEKDSKQLSTYKNNKLVAHRQLLAQRPPWREEQATFL